MHSMFLYRPGDGKGMSLLPLSASVAGQAEGFGWAGQQCACRSQASDSKSFL